MGHYTTLVCDLCHVEKRQEFDKEFAKVTLPSKDRLDIWMAYDICDACYKVYQELCDQHRGHLLAFAIGRTK